MRGKPFYSRSDALTLQRSTLQRLQRAWRHVGAAINGSETARVREAGNDLSQAIKQLDVGSDVPPAALQIEPARAR